MRTEGIKEEKEMVGTEKERMMEKENRSLGIAEGIKE